MQENQPRSQTEFSMRLRELVRTAHENDVDVEGGWNCRYESDLPDWEVAITEVVKRFDE